LARTAVEHYADSVWLVELAPVADPALVPQLVATAVGVREAAGQAITSALTTALRNRHSLLVLDNCEHLLEACARLIVDLVRYCADLQVRTCKRSLRNKSRPDSTSASVYSLAVVERFYLASRRCARPWTGVTTCCQSVSSYCSTALKAAGVVGPRFIRANANVLSPPKRARPVGLSPRPCL
jgi:hypothetical protein